MKSFLSTLILFLSFFNLQFTLAGDEKSVTESIYSKEILDKEVAVGNNPNYTKKEYVYVSASKTNTIYIKHHYSNSFLKGFAKSGTEAFTAVVYELKIGETITINSELDDERYTITYLHDDGAIGRTFKLKIERSKLPK